MPPVHAQIITRWDKRGYVPFDVRSISAHMVDSAIDTDTDSWNLSIGDVDNLLVDMLKRDNEVRVNLFATGKNRVMSLNTGFADEISFDHDNNWTISGRDLTAVAVDSQHPPQIWHGIRPQVLVAREARFLKIADKLRLDSAQGFKTYATDGSESYWQVWYRFYRKRRKWLYAEPDGEIVGASLDYNQREHYFFGSPQGMISNRGSNWIPVEALEWRADKTQRVGEVFVFGHRGDIGFVAQAVDPSTRSWVKRPTKIFTSSDVHNQAEARIEAWEEIFESKVGSVEIKLTVFDPGFLIRQNRMAVVNLPSVHLRGTFFIVGVQTVGSLDQGQFQVVRLREKNFAISRRVVSDPVLNAGPNPETAGNVADNLSGGFRWKDSFVEAATTYHGPWSFQLFLAVLLSICQQESDFRNVRQGGIIEWPGTYEGVPDGRPPSVFQGAAMEKFVRNFANAPKFHRVGTEWGVGPMQLTTDGYKILADRFADPNLVDDELVGGRWNPDANIKAAAAALAGKLGAGYSISSDGQLRKVPVSGLSLKPSDENIWAGVAAYNGSGQDALNYAKSVRAIYNDTYKTQVDAAIKGSMQDVASGIDIPQQTSFVLRNRVLDDKAVEYIRQSQIDDIRLGRIVDDILKFMLVFTDAGFPIVVKALRTDHSLLTSEGRPSLHGQGKAIDMGNYTLGYDRTRYAMTWIGQHQLELGIDELIGPFPELVFPLGAYDAKTLNEHKDHIHVGVDK